MDRAAGNRNKTRTEASRRPGYAYRHNEVDDQSRLTNTKILTDEKKETAAGLWQRAKTYFNEVGITVKRVLTDNGSCYCPHAFKDALGPDFKHKRTRPYRPATNGKVQLQSPTAKSNCKVQLFNSTLLEEWAYAKPYSSEAERIAAFLHWLHYYNHKRRRSSLKGLTPADRVPNLRG